MKSADQYENGAEGENVRVVLRCRPLSEKEIDIDSAQVAVKCTRDEVVIATDGDKPATFKYDAVLGPESTQAQCYTEIGQPIIDKCFAGFNCTIFAYGQTGSGKTHTMVGNENPEERGIIPRTASGIFDRIGKAHEEKSTVSFLTVVSFFEIYNEIIR